MRLIVILLIITFSITSCQSQIGSEQKKTEKKLELKPPFSNQGEQEDYWAQELFKKEYDKKYYPKFLGKIITSESKIRFGKFKYIEFLDTNSKY